MRAVIYDMAANAKTNRMMPTLVVMWILLGSPPIRVKVPPVMQRMRPVTVGIDKSLKVRGVNSPFVERLMDSLLSVSGQIGMAEPGDHDKELRLTLG